MTRGPVASQLLMLPEQQDQLRHVATYNAGHRTAIALQDYPKASRFDDSAPHAISDTHP